MARAFGSVIHPLLLAPSCTPPEIVFPSLSGSATPFSSRRVVTCRPSPFSRTAALRRQPVSTSALVTEQAGKGKFPADVQVTETKLPRSSVRLSVDVPPAVSMGCYEKVLHEFAKQAKVPGFRPGKRIPENVLVNYVGKEHVRHATIEAILKMTLPHATSMVKGRALKDSIRIITKFSEMDERFSLHDFFRYDVLVDVTPEVKWITENGYKDLKVIVEIDNTITAEVAAELELRRRHKSLGTLRIVTDRGLQVGDLVVLDIFATTVEEDESEGEKIPSAERKGFHLDTEETDGLLPGFLESIKGIRQNEAKVFTLTFPDSWEQQNLQGVRAQFTVTCKELFYRDLPEMEDSLAEKLLLGCSTLDQVRKLILQRCREVEQTARDQATDNAILDQLCKIVDVDIPQSLLEEQGRELYGAHLLQLQASRRLDEHQLASLSSEKALKDYLESRKEQISNVIKQMLAVGEIYRGENLQCSAEELVKEVESSVAEFKQHNQEYDEDRVRQQVQEILEGAKVLEWLRENAEIQYITR